MKCREPDARELEIIRRNGIDPNEVAVVLSAEEYIVLLVFRTRDTITINRGDKLW